MFEFRGKVVPVWVAFQRVLWLKGEWSDRVSGVFVNERVEECLCKVQGQEWLCVFEGSMS